MKSHAGLLAVLGFFAVCSSAPADVETAGETHFTVVTSISVKAKPQAAWEHLLKIGSWWSSAHTWSGDANNLSLSVVPGGGFDEKLRNGGFVRHMDVIYSDPGAMLRMNGVLGPLQEFALQGTMTITFSEDGDATKISATYRVSGHFAGGLENVAPAVDSVLTEQFRRLGEIIEGRPPGEPDKK